MKKYLLFFSIIPFSLFAQDKQLDGIYSSPNPRIINISGIDNSNDRLVTTGSYASDIKVSRTVEKSGFPLQQELKVYPNPVVSDTRALFSSQEFGQPYQLQVISLEGRSLFLRSGKTVKGTNTIQFNMSMYPTGSYYLQLFVGNRKEMVRFLKVER